MAETTSPTPHRWWGIKQAAAYLEIHPRTMYNRARKSLRKYANKRTGMPVVQLNGKGPLKFPIEAFKTWAEHPVD